MTEATPLLRKEGLAALALPDNRLRVEGRQGLHKRHKVGHVLHIIGHRDVLTAKVLVALDAVHLVGNALLDVVRFPGKGRQAAVLRLPAKAPNVAIGARGNTGNPFTLFGVLIGENDAVVDVFNHAAAKERRGSPKAYD